MGILEIILVAVAGVFAIVFKTKHDTRKEERIKDENHRLKQRELAQKQLREKTIEASQHANNINNVHDTDKLRERRAKDPHNRNRNRN